HEVEAAEQGQQLIAHHRDAGKLEDLPIDEAPRVRTIADLVGVFLVAQLRELLDLRQHAACSKAPVLTARLHERDERAEIETIRRHAEDELGGRIGTRADRAGMAYGAVEVDAIDAHAAAHRHADRKIEARILTVLVDHAECRVAAARLAVGQILGKHLGQGDPDPIGYAEPELVLPAALAAGGAVLEVLDVVGVGNRLVVVIAEDSVNAADQHDCDGEGADSTQEGTQPAQADYAPFLAPLRVIWSCGVAPNELGMPEG